VVALSGDYDFQFMIEELAVGAQFGCRTSTWW
jgi:tartronate-semialdehyde synthase